MSGQPPPSTDPEWARQVQQRLDALDRPQTVSVGPWSLNVGPGGRLQAQHNTTGVTVVVAMPDGSPPT